MLSYFFEKLILFLDNKSQNKNLDFIIKINGKKLPIIFDIGCHKGETLDLIKKKFFFRKIYAFEPNKELVGTLKVKHKDVYFIDKAVGEKNCKKIYYKSKFSPINTLNKKNNFSNYLNFKKKIISKIYFNNNLDVEEEVDVISLKTFIKNLKIQSVDLIKIDTEGYEFYVIKGLGNYLKKIKILLFEHHYDDSLIKNYKFSDINSLLVKNGFKLAFKNKMLIRNIYEYIYVNQCKF